MVTGQIALPVQIIGISLMILCPLILIWGIWRWIVSPLAEKIKSKGRRKDTLLWMSLWAFGISCLGAILALANFLNHRVFWIGALILTSVYYSLRIYFLKKRIGKDGK